MPRILVVDDEPDHRRICAAALYYNGFDVAEAATGYDALRDSNEGVARPDLILLDLQLPDISGFTVLDIIRSRPGFEDLPIICVTGVDDVGPKDIVNRGFVDLLHKPIKIEKLIGMIRKHLPTIDNQ